MSYTAKELLKLASDYDNVATRALVVTAEKKEKKKLDPKAKVRNRGTVCVTAEQAKDKKDHFPINDEGQARNALARVQQLSSAPWYKGSLEGLKALVARKVKAKYPGINVGGKDSKKKASEYYDTFLNKFAQQVGYGVGLSHADKQRLMGLVSALAGNNGPLSKELSDAFGRLATQRTLQNGTSYFVPEYVQQFLPTLDKVKVALNAARPNGPEYNTAAELYDIFKSMSVATKPDAAPKAGLPVREDVRAAQNQLYRANAEFAEKLEQSGGVDGKLGKTTIQLLKEYLPRMDAESAVKYLADEEKKEHAPQAEPEQPAPNPYNNQNKTWGGEV